MEDIVLIEIQRSITNLLLDDQVSSVLLSDKITKNDIEKSNYQIVRSPDFFVRKSFLMKNILQNLNRGF